MQSQIFSWFGYTKSEPSPQRSNGGDGEPSTHSGESHITHQIQPGTATEFDEEWRSVNWNGRDQIEAELRELKIQHPDITQLRIIVYGAVGAGKSSFINSAQSVFEHRIKNTAGVAGGLGTSHTKKYKSYKINDGKNGTLPFIFSDVMGTEEARANGIHPDDIINVIQGHVKDNHVFNPVCALKDGDPGYISSPTPNDKAHCVVSVISAKTAPVMYEKAFTSINSAWEKASELGIPHVLLLTYIDEYCPLVKKNLKNVYISRTIYKMMKDCSNKTRIPMTCIFPVKNYNQEIDTNNDTDVLVLLALRQILNFANDYVKDL